MLLLLQVKKMHLFTFLKPHQRPQENFTIYAIAIDPGKEKSAESSQQPNTLCQITPLLV